MSCDVLIQYHSHLQVDRLPAIPFRSDLGEGQVLRRGRHPA